MGKTRGFLQRWGPGGLLLLLAGCAHSTARQPIILPTPQASVITYAAPYPPSPQARWPWPKAVKEAPHKGVTHWIDKSSPDGTLCELLDFDFAANPSLRLELYDQDEDDARPFDDKVVYWPNGVGSVTRHLNQLGRGPVLAAWNGLFFDSPHSPASHVAPVVLNGHVHYNVGLIRWAFGVQYDDLGHPQFKTLHEPSKTTLARELTYGAEGAQCLVLNGQPLKLQPFPKTGDITPPTPVPSTAQEAGHIPGIDHIKTSRTTMGWTRDNRHFYLLIVKEPDTETGSFAFLHGAKGVDGGWTLADEQRFWLAKGVWGAVNIDGGDVTQLTMLRRDGRYDMVPPRWASPAMRLQFGPNFANAPQGGTMMYFYVRENGMNFGGTSPDQNGTMRYFYGNESKPLIHFSVRGPGHP
ncbi:MAG: phosphodiester glycosidase family protein [Armatimonadota bacterium]|nr:phosphodiester glycosidase family protein [Armatimonadota bacterium]